MNLVSAESIRRPEVIRWHKRIVERYTPPEGIGLTVLLPCSARKPYSKSKSHMTFRRHIKSGATDKYPLVHEVVLTSPLGLVPKELEEVYPAAHYDVPVTGVWSEEEKEFAIRLLRDYMNKTSVTTVGYAEGTYKEICEEMNVETVSGDPAELEKLVSEKLGGQETSPQVSQKLRKIRAVCDFQFGRGASDYLLKDTPRIKGLQVYDEDSALIATIDRRIGLLALSLRGAERLFDFGSYIVELSFRPETNSIFSVGIERADHIIRPRDEVIVVYEGEVIGTGKAVLSGHELERAEKGLGINLRHRRK
jgi:archaeosine synthase